MNLAEIKAWVELLIVIGTAAVALWHQYQGLKDQKEMNRKAKILALVPSAHNLAQRIAENTNTKKDDEFLRQMDVLLDAFGIEWRTDAEREAARKLGSAHHLEFKMARDAAPLTDEDAAKVAGKVTAALTGAVLPGEAGLGGEAPAGK